MYQNHILVDKAYKNRNMRGHVLCSVIYLHHESTRWRESEKQRFRDTLSEVTTLLESEASKEGVELRFTVKEGELICNASPAERPKGLEDALAKKHGYETAIKYADYLKKMYRADDILLIIVRNEPIWEYATPNPNLGACFVSQSSRAPALMHEILHLYGIKDLYIPAIKDIAEYCFGDSAMSTCLELGPQSIDPLARHLLGWKEQPGPVASWFLDQTQNITHEQFESSRRIKSNDLDAVFRASKPFSDISALEKAAAAKDPWALFLIGLCYQHAIYLPQDLQKAEQFYKESFSGSCGPAGYAVVDILLSKKVLMQNDKATAHRILLTLQNNPHHIFGISLYAACLYSGFSFQERCLEDALSVVITNLNHYNYANFDEKTQFRKLPEVIQQHKLLEKLSCELPELHTSVKQMVKKYADIECEGDGILRFLFAKLLTDGTHPRPNPRRALELYLKAAQQGLSVACNAVSNCYRNGIGTIADPVAAQLWKERAAQARLKEDGDPTTRLAIQILNRFLDDTHSCC